MLLLGRVSLPDGLALRIALQALLDQRPGQAAAALGPHCHLRHPQEDKSASRQALLCL